MPAETWHKIMKSESLQLLYKYGKGPDTDDLMDRWLDLQQEYFDEFGVEDSFEELIRIKLRLIKLNYDYIITGDRFLLNLIEIAEIDLKLWGDDEEATFYESITYASKYMGYRIRPSEISVLEWGYIVRAMSNEAAANEASETPTEDE